MSSLNPESDELPLIMLELQGLENVIRSSFHFAYPALFPPILVLMKRFSDIGGLSPKKPLPAEFSFPDGSNLTDVVTKLTQMAETIDSTYPSGFNWRSEISAITVGFETGKTAQTSSQIDVKALEFLVDRVSLIDCSILDRDTDYFSAAFSVMCKHMFASSRDDFSTENTPLEDFIVENLKVEDGNEIYCPNIGDGIGIGTFNLQMNLQRKPWNSLSFSGQEINPNALKLAQLKTLAKETDGKSKFNWNFVNSEPITSPILDSGKLKRFDRVFSIIPFGRRGLNYAYDLESDPYNRFQFGVPPQSHMEWALIQHCLACTKDDGLCIVVSHLGPLVRQNLQEIREKVINTGWLKAVVKLPSNSAPGTFLNVFALIFDKRPKEKKEGKILFVDGQRQRIRMPLKPHVSSELTKIIDALETNDFVSKLVEIEEVKRKDSYLDVGLYADDSEQANHLRELQKSYPSYKYYQFDNEDVVEEIVKVKSVKDIDEGTANCIYMPNIANMKPVVDLKAHLKDKKTKPDRYWRVKLNPAKVDALYVEYFFRSDLGKAIYNALGSGATIQHVKLDALRRCKMAFPDLATQSSILQTVNKLDRLNELSQSFKKEVSLNPDSAINLVKKLDDMLAVVEQLSDEDHVMSLVRSGESKTVEFKETFEYNQHVNGNRDKRLILECIETVAAFMNTDGGDLLVGIHDSGEIVGIERDIKMHKKGIDGFMLHLKNYIQNKIGEQFYPLINQRIVQVSGKPILRVTCQPSDTRVFVDKKDFFVRTTPATDKLEGEALLQYLERRFPKSG